MSRKKRNLTRRQETFRKIKAWFEHSLYSDPERFEVLVAEAKVQGRYLGSSDPLWCVKCENSNGFFRTRFIEKLNSRFFICKNCMHVVARPRNEEERKREEVKWMNMSTKFENVHSINLSGVTKLYLNPPSAPVTKVVSDPYEEWKE